MSNDYFIVHDSSSSLSSAFEDASERCREGQSSPAQGRCTEITKSPDTLTQFLRMFAFHMDDQILDCNILIISVNCQRSTLSSIISGSFEFLLAASMHKFHKG